MYLEYGGATGVCSAFCVVATFRGNAVRTDAALAIVFALDHPSSGSLPTRERPALLSG